MVETFTGNKGLQIEEPLIFEQGSKDLSAVDIGELDIVLDCLGGLTRDGEIGLSGLSEPKVIRHYTRLSQKNYNIDAGFYPLGSCTMKYNPRLNEKMARLAGFADVHPCQPDASAQGALELVYTLAQSLKELTGMVDVAMSPAAGAHGELCGIMTIKAAHVDSGEDANRSIVLVPESAHGTNPATAALCGYKIENIKTNEQGRVDLAYLQDRLSDDKGLNVAALMLTNPNTCGLFERDIVKISELLHKAGAYFYLDGANFNAVVGRVRIADLGVDVMHINLHKTFSTPHGGGGPGSGPTVLSEKLSKYAPLPFVEKLSDGSFKLVEHAEECPSRKPFGRMKGFNGQFGVFVRALSYIMSMGKDGLKQASGDAVLNANYIMSQLKGDYHACFEGYCMHEALFDDSSLKGTDVTTLDIAKSLLDEGFHPMTMYFPLVVHGAMLIEPTETEAKETLDSFIGAMKHILSKAKSDAKDEVLNAPVLTPVKRLDETKAARTPILRFEK